MKLLQYIKKAASLPPRILLQKIQYRMKKQFLLQKRKIRDTSFSSYELLCPHTFLHRFLKDVDLSQFPKEPLSRLNNLYLQHQFDLLGSGWTAVFHGMLCKGLEGVVFEPKPSGPINPANAKESLRIKALLDPAYRPIDWHLDFKSGYRWEESTRSEKIQYGHLLGVDVKVPWELARMQHLFSFALGYALEKHPAYAIEFRNQILDFIASNPPRYGVNWVYSMDVGIRVANWLLAYDLLKDCGAHFDEAFEQIFVRSIYEHAKHIFHHLEWDPYLRSNHYLANITGLLFASSYLPKDREIQSWLDFAITELQKEGLEQFHADGSNFEASTSYHRLSGEMILFGTVMALEVGATFSSIYLDRLQKIADFIRDITKPDETIVQCGDNDSGRFMKIPPEEKGLDHRYLIRPFRNLKSLRSLIEDLSSPSQEKPAALSMYPDFGLYILRRHSWFIAIRCGSIGQKGNGGHAHNDQLSFELAIEGISMIVDPGTYLYTPLPEKRRLFRSVTAHNTLAFEDREQNLDEGIFKMTDRACAKLIQFHANHFIGEHQGFGFPHRRELLLTDNVLQGIDTLEGNLKGSASQALYFHLAPSWRIQSMDRGKAVCQHEQTTIELQTAHGHWISEPYHYSRGYGLQEKAFVLVLFTHAKTTHWEIKWYNKEAAKKLSIKKQR
ncbi:MAG: hypothetical protein A3D96_05645 [Chlamydiae bacterium RIFCSPHIGHO2_12_FULL_44_59]|nr:MAG: hypothetical protein A2796_03475 [Chlamydiae bacterium RIFCSPHIGHO2_01_FULL_44_39]OGN58651.1 MAG: hypothetical protein A3C42_00085 [Chlamydiae bacterium RIFCSPHIGHO2_02_FULL_45_9]OGN61115.1 MAG: hypothetical protein A3D96_05645 [Chlamydiae bacterium RIFCSPHIGHO2_12_FULL_44_59]OGN65585.1 MAG: hypothetical protein A2978_06450 [Chlamydiae bacterium RIFCSPLOWO2_01_FULL_44_52]OGN68062.1 MAG: hypothetical protein A3I67_05120 [Chlamydiae bacterium RIFCSPLOWO2_02_FULL_45_22]OGN68951.1 MAG: hyp